MVKLKGSKTSKTVTQIRKVQKTYNGENTGKQILYRRYGIDRINFVSLFHFLADRCKYCSIFLCCSNAISPEETRETLM